MTGLKGCFGGTSNKASITLFFLPVELYRGKLVSVGQDDMDFGDRSGLLQGIWYGLRFGSLLSVVPCLNGWVNDRINDACINEPLYMLEMSLGFSHASASASASAHAPWFLILGSRL